MSRDYYDSMDGRINHIPKSEQAATDHWNWMQPLLEYIYKTAFLHGWKHRGEDKDSDGGKE